MPVELVVLPGLLGCGVEQCLLRAAHVFRAVEPDGACGGFEQVVGASGPFEDLAVGEEFGEGVCVGGVADLVQRAVGQVLLPGFVAVHVLGYLDAEQERVHCQHGVVGPGQVPVGPHVLNLLVGHADGAGGGPDDGEAAVCGIYVGLLPAADAGGLEEFGDLRSLWRGLDYLPGGEVLGLVVRVDGPVEGRVELDHRQVDGVAYLKVFGVDALGVGGH